jgi:phage tail-like protein
MARTSVGDPLEKFRFKVQQYSTTVTQDVTIIHNLDTLVGFNTVQMPKLSTNKINYREGDNLLNVSSLSPGLSTTEDIILSRGVVAESWGWFYFWAKTIHSGQATDAAFNYNDPGNAFKPQTEVEYVRKDLVISMADRTGKTTKAWIIYNAFPVQFTPGSDLDASADDSKSIASLTLAYESFKELAVNSSTGIPIF